MILVMCGREFYKFWKRPDTVRCIAVVAQANLRSNERVPRSNMQYCVARQGDTMVNLTGWSLASNFFDEVVGTSKLCETRTGWCCQNCGARTLK